MSQSRLASRMSEMPVSDVLLIEEVPVSDDDAGVIALMTINRPAKLNALNSAVSDALKAAMTWATNTEKVRVVVISGASPQEPLEGKRAKPAAFVAGADITDFVGKDSEAIRIQFADNAWEAIWLMPKPCIAMIDGFTLGGGLEVALSCDIRFATDRSRFATPEINLGLIPGGGATQRLCHLVGYGKAMELVLSGEMIDAIEAHRIGLVNHLTSIEELKEKTMEFAKNLALKSPLTIQVAKQAVRDALESTLSDGVLLEREAFAELFDTDDMRIGVDAFLNRGKPEWTGK
jgi:enoyl-CoA hydratase